MARIRASAQALISVALAEVGYLEKSSASQLDSKTGNSGYRNFTKYARDLDNIPNFYNGKKQGVAWCDMFVDWCMLQAFGLQAGQKLLCQPDRSYGAGCPSSVNYYKAQGRFFTDTPQPGDQIFFWDSGRAYAAHTGIVYKTDENYVYTVEGNTSSQAGVIANGGGVFQKSYALGHSRICGYGRPDYQSVWYEADRAEIEEKEATFPLDIRILKNGAQGADIAALQHLLIGNGFSCGSWGADGSFGKATEDALRAYQQKSALSIDGIAGPATWSSLLGVS